MILPEKKPSYGQHGLIDSYFGSSAEVIFSFMKKKPHLLITKKIKYLFIARVVTHFRYGCFSFTSLMWDYAVEVVF